MRINGIWVEDEGGLRRPMVFGSAKTESGAWIDCPFLIDTGADRTVLSAVILQQLGRPTAPAPRQLSGVGGAVETLQVWTEIRLTRTDGAAATISAHYAAFTDPNALEESVLGRDILSLFAVIIDQPQQTICFLHGRHRYTIQEA